MTLNLAKIRKANQKNNNLLILLAKTGLFS